MAALGQALQKLVQSPSPAGGTTPPRPRMKLPKGTPPEIHRKLERGRRERDKGRITRQICQRFFEGDHYFFKLPNGRLSFQTSGGTQVAAADKSQYRIRNTYNYAGLLIEAKVSGATQSIPGYEITPSTDDYEDEAAAILAEQVATYEYDNLRMRKHSEKVVTLAFVQREGFARPYFDPNIGPFTQTANGYEGRGEIRLLSLTRDEVIWEPGVDFDDSRWHAIERAMLREEIEALPGYVGGDLEPDALTAQLPAGKTSPEMTVMTEYLERPSPTYPQGRRMFFVNGRIAVDYRLDPACPQDWEDWWEPYSYTDANGDVCDEPEIHRISYTVNPVGEDLGLMERVIDLQRTINDCWNKLLEWKNRALMPQMLAPKGSNVMRRDDTPGATWYYNVVAGLKPEWEQTPRVPQELFQMLQEAQNAMRDLMNDLDLATLPRMPAAGVDALQTMTQSRWQSFLGDLADFHSRLMRHILCLVARYYDTERQIEIRGQYGWAPLSSFTGQDLRSQVNVRVLPGTLDTKTRQTIQQEIQFVQSNWPGAITPEAALGTLHGGSAEGLIRSYQNDVARAYRVIRRLKTGPQAMNSFGERFDPDVPAIDLQTGQPIMGPPGPPVADPQTGMVMPGQPQQVMGMNVPGWMPAPWDNIAIWRQVLGDYMKTEDYESLEQPVQEQFVLMWRGLDQADQMRAAKQAAQQQMQAQSLGMNNAAAPQSPPPLPDRAGFTPDNASPVPQAPQ